MRLNKYISETGMCSRREADRLIAERQVTINGKIAELGTQVEDGDAVRVGKRLISGSGQAPARRPKKVYIALNKPVGITCTTIGRLDKESEGLILLTNNGDIVNDILRAENNHDKEYLVSVDKAISEAFLIGMANGVRIDNVTTKPCKISRLGKFGFRIILTQGLNRQIRKMCEVFGYEVRQLQRVRIVNVQLGKLRIGQWRNLTEVELRGLLPERAQAGLL